MKRAAILVLSLLGLSAAALPAAAQSGFALKGHYIVNASKADDAREAREIPHADAFGLGAELVLPLGLGVGISGYTTDTEELNFRTSEFTVLAEANYFLRLPLLPIAPYAGVHAGLGSVSGETASNPGLKLEDRTRSQLGYQLGVRLQATQLIGIDAQWRRMSSSASESQGERLKRDQVLLGITLF